MSSGEWKFSRCLKCLVSKYTCSLHGKYRANRYRPIENTTDGKSSGYEWVVSDFLERQGGGLRSRRTRGLARNQAVDPVSDDDEAAADDIVIPDEPFNLNPDFDTATPYHQDWFPPMGEGADSASDSDRVELGRADGMDDGNNFMADHRVWEEEDVSQNAVGSVPLIRASMIIDS